MGVTVRDAMADDCLRGARLLAGERSLDNEIKGVNIMEVPDVVRWLRGGELLLTAAFAFRNDPDLTRELPWRLVEKGVAALGVKPGQYIETVPMVMVHEAETAGLPLIELPSSLPYADVMVPILQRVMDHQVSRLTRRKRIYDELLRVDLQGGGMAGICSAVSVLTGASVAVLDDVLSEIAGKFVCREPDSVLQLRERMVAAARAAAPGATPGSATPEPAIRRTRVHLPGSGNDLEMAVCPVWLCDALCGYVVASKDEAFSDEDVIAIEQAGTVTALEFATRRSVFEAELLLRTEFMSDLIKADSCSDGSIARRARAFRLNVHSSIVFVAVEADMTSPPRLPADKVGYPTVSRNTMLYLVSLAQSLFDGYGGTVIAHMRRGMIVCALDHPQGRGLEILEAKCRSLQDLAAGRAGVRVSIGIGEPSRGVETIRQAYEKSEQALRLGVSLKGPGSVTCFKELGYHRLLHALRGSEEFARFRDDVLGPLMRSDRERGTSYCKTLSTYFRARESMQRAANELYVHRNTLLYRLRRIQALLKMDLRDPDDNLTLNVATRMLALSDPEADDNPGTT